MALVELKNVSKLYHMGDVSTSALQGINLEIEKQAFISFVGPSGSGKSTLLNLIGCLDQPTTGSIHIAGDNVSKMDRVARARFRGQHMGFVFQSFNLIPVLTVYENVEYPLLMVRDKGSGNNRDRILQMLEAVGVLDQKDKLPTRISGGQQQRVAIARALITDPKLVIADEPTANLDHTTAFKIIDLMKTMRDRQQATFLFSTHDPKIIGEAETIYRLEDGEIKGQENGRNHVNNR